MLSIISGIFTEKKIPFCLIGAFALGAYGVPRYTSDFDLLTDGKYWESILPVMEKLGYACFQKTDSLAQFDSELGVYGRVDMLLVSTQDGRDILKRCTMFNDEAIGRVPVVQPSDYIVLKLMAIANNPDRKVKDESDIDTLMGLYRNNLMPVIFKPIEKDRIMFFAKRFGQEKLIKKYLDGNEFKKEKNHSL